MAKNPVERMEKELARFDKKGGGFVCPKCAATIWNDGDRARCDCPGGYPTSYDLMEREFRPYKFKVEGIYQDEEAYLQTGRDARDSRLVIMASGGIGRAVGSLQDGSGYLVDQYGTPINRTPQAPVTPMPRRSKDW